MNSSLHLPAENFSTAVEVRVSVQIQVPGTTLSVNIRAVCVKYLYINFPYNSGNSGILCFNHFVGAGQLSSRLGVRAKSTLQTGMSILSWFLRERCKGHKSTGVCVTRGCPFFV